VKRRPKPVVMPLDRLRSKAVARLAGALALSALPDQERWALERRARLILENLSAGGGVK